MRFLKNFIFVVSDFLHSHYKLRNNLPISITKAIHPYT